MDFSKEFLMINDGIITSQWPNSFEMILLGYSIPPRVVAAVVVIVAVAVVVAAVVVVVVNSVLARVLRQSDDISKRLRKAHPHLTDKLNTQQRQQQQQQQQQQEQRQHQQ